MQIKTAQDVRIPRLLISDSETETGTENGKNEQDNKSNCWKILNEVKEDVKLIKPKLLKRDSEAATDVVEKLYGFIVELTAQKKIN